jgi:hypothetical protein
MNTHAKIEESVSKQRIGKHTTGVLLETVFSVWSVQCDYKEALQQRIVGVGSRM